MSTTLDHPDVRVIVADLPDGKRNVSISPARDGVFISLEECQTTYSVDLIRLILDIKGPYLCDEIMREQDPSYVQSSLEDSVFLYVSKADFDNRRVLDFGCGSGASTAILARMFPRTEIVGIDLDDGFLSIARARIQHYGYDNIKFELSPSGDELPSDIGDFDFIMLSAVFEHLLPAERVPVLQQLWEVVKPGGVLFINQTPNRYFPIESHTTGLPLLNYVPDKLAYHLAKRFSKAVSEDDKWDTLLRKGIRGGTEREIGSILREKCTGAGTFLRPRDPRLKDSIDVWHNLSKNKQGVSKRLARMAFKTIRLATGVSVVPYHLMLAIQKDQNHP